MARTQRLMLNGYPQDFSDSVTKSRRNNSPSTDRIPLSTVAIPYVRGTSKKPRRLGNHFNIRTIFTTNACAGSPLWQLAQTDTYCSQGSVCVCVCVPSHVSAIDVMLAKRVDPWKCVLRDTNITLGKVFWNNQNMPNMPTKNDARYVGIKPGF
jgi:hypothetical protein